MKQALRMDEMYFCANLLEDSWLNNYEIYHAIPTFIAFSDGHLSGRM